MNENSSIDPKVLVDAARAANEILPQTVTETDSAISTLIGWFNNVVLHPVKKANIKFQYKLECFEEDLRKKVAEIPEGKICEPNLMIAGPTLEALKYTYDEQKLREMFVNLLASSMNCDKNKFAHPAFVEIIKQLSPLDAKLINLFGHKDNFPCIEVFKKHSDNKFTPMLQNIFDFFDNNADFNEIEFIQLTMSLDNVTRLGLVEKDSEFIELNYDYNLLKKHWLYKAYEATLETNSSLNIRKYRIGLTELGRAFKKCCLN